MVGATSLVTSLLLYFHCHFIVIVIVTRITHIPSKYGICGYLKSSTKDFVSPKTVWPAHNLFTLGYLLTYLCIRHQLLIFLYVNHPASPKQSMGNIEA